MKIGVLVVGLFLLLPLASRADEEDPCKALAVAPAPPAETGKPAKKDKNKKDDLAANLVPLSLVICEVQHALDAYQADPEVDKQHAIPKLLTADFDFKTVVDTKASFGISILVFKFGVSYDKQNTNEVDFQYEPKSRKKTGPFTAVQPPNFQQELIDTIKAAAKAKQEQEKVQSLSKDPLVFKQLSVSLSFGVTKDVNVNATIPIHLVTLTPGLDHSRNSVQSVKLVFNDQDSKP